MLNHSNVAAAAGSNSAQINNYGLDKRQIEAPVKKHELKLITQRFWPFQQLKWPEPLSLRLEKA